MPDLPAPSLRCCRRWVLLSLLLACAAGRLAAAPSFRVDKAYPDLGLKFRLLAGSEPEPLAQYKTLTYTVTRGGEKSNIDLFDVHELWYGSQHAGQWRDEAGNQMILGRMSTLPLDLGEKAAAREAIDGALADPANAFVATNAAAFATWVQAFANCRPGTPEPLKSSFFNLAGAVHIPVTEPNRVVYLFRVKTRSASGQPALSEWFCAVIAIADGTPAAKVRKDFETQFLATVAPIPKSAAGGSAGGGGGGALVVNTPGSRQKAAPVIPDHPSRTAARKSIANLKDWWFAETPEYIFISDIRSVTGKSLVRDLQANMPILRGAFGKLVPPLKPVTDVSVVRIYEEQAAYQQYVGASMAWSIGCWAPLRRELVILSQGKAKEQTMEIIRHEGFHQYLFYACDMIENAVWFNEGHACFCECAEIDNQGRVTFPEDRNRLGTLLGNLDNAAARIPTILRFDHAGFYSGTDSDRDLNYTTAWALVYYLRKGAPTMSPNPYADVLPNYLKTLPAAAKDPPVEATAAAFKDIDMTAFQADFVAFWKKGRKAAERIDPLALAAGDAASATRH